MSEIENQQDATKPKKRKIGVLKKLDTESARLLQSLKDRANKKQFGRKVRDGEILAVSLTLVAPDHIRELQEKTYSETDRLKLLHEEFQKKNGKISIDEFIGRLLRGQISNRENSQSHSQ